MPNAEPVVPIPGEAPENNLVNSLSSSSSVDPQEQPNDPTVNESTSLWFLLGLNAYNAPNNLCLMTLGIILLPAEAKRMFPDNKAIMLGLLLMVTGVTQLICPFIGQLVPFFAEPPLTTRPLTHCTFFFFPKCVRPFWTYFDTRRPLH